MIPKDATVAEVLAALDEWMLHNHAGFDTGPECKKGTNLWLILSALRGPDNPTLELKQATLHVRYTAFPLNARALSFPALLRPASLDEANHLVKDVRDYDSQHHFAEHIRLAVTALRAST